MLIRIDELARHRSVQLDAIECEPAVELLQHIDRIEIAIDGEWIQACAGSCVPAAKRLPALAAVGAVPEIDGRAELACRPAHRTRGHDAHDPAAVAHVEAGGRVRGLDPRRAQGAHVDPVHPDAVAGARDVRAGPPRFGHVAAAHQHGAVLAAAPIDDLAVELADAGVVEGALLAQQLQILARRID